MLLEPGTLVRAEQGWPSLRWLAFFCPEKSYPVGVRGCFIFLSDGFVPTYCFVLERRSETVTEETHTSCANRRKVRSCGRTHGRAAFHRAARSSATPQPGRAGRAEPDDGVLGPHTCVREGLLLSAVTAHSTSPRQRRSHHCFLSTRLSMCFLSCSGQAQPELSGFISHENS